MAKKSFKIKFIAASVLLFQIIFLNYSVVLAYTTMPSGNFYGGSFPEPTSTANDIITNTLERFNVSEDNIKDMAQQSNVSNQKMQTPQVSLFFNPSDLKNGEKSTASAAPMYFTNTSEKLYYTWYIKHKKCGLTDNPSSEEKQICDADGDGNITVNDWKVEAMRIVATGGYDKKLDQPAPDYDNDNDHDGYFAPLGGGDKYASTDGSTPAYCYVQDVSKGITYKIGQKSDTKNEPKYEAVCPDGTTAVCVNTVSNTCQSTGTPTCENSTMACASGSPRCIDNNIFNDSKLYTNDAGKTYSGGTFKYKRVADPDISPNPSPAGYPSECEAGLFYGDAKCSDSSTSGASKCFNTKWIVDGDGLTTETYDDSATSTCTSGGTTYTLSYYTINGWENFMRGGLDSNPLTGLGCDTYAKDYTITTPTACTVTGQSYDESDGRTCDHMFPKINESGSLHRKTGDGEFGGDEENFWGTNPQSANTAGNGNLDEANVSGLGQNSFSWTYQEGDKVGVIVEGASMIPTKYEDNSYMIMWALPKNIFKLDDDKKGTETGYAKGYTFSVPTYDGNPIDDSLEDNLVDPAEQSNEKLDVSLDASPENPVNDSSGDQMGDVLSINSSVSNSSQNSSQLRYEWKIGAGKTISGSFDYTLSKKLVDSKLITGSLSGINNPNIGIKLDLGKEYADYFDKDGISYIKINVTAKEALSGKTRVGRGEIVVKIVSTDKRIKTYLITSSNGETLSKGDLICDKTTVSSSDDYSYYICPVVKNQILKLEINKDDLSDVAWTVNGNAYTCDSSYLGSSNCPDGSNNLIFIPISGNEGDEIDVKMSGKKIDTDLANPSSSNGKSIEITKSFQIVKPYVKIIPSDNSSFWPKVLGNYKDLDGNLYPDLSDTEFETYNGAKVSLEAEFHPIWLAKTGTLAAQWLLDDTDVTSASAPGEIKFTADKSVGENYSVKFKAAYDASNGTRKALKNYWGITQNESTGETLSNSITGEVIEMDNPTGTSFLNKPAKFLASIISNLPSQSIFLLRMALVIFVIILISGLAFSVLPDLSQRQK